MIIGTLLIVFTWVSFVGMGLPVWAGVLLTILGALIIFFGLTFGVYMLNLDMKLTAKLEPLFLKHYDKIKRDQHL